MELNSGATMPMMGLGTYLSDCRETVIENVKYAILECGIRHIDTASSYQNEDAIGEALQQCFDAGIKREEIFITTKCFKDEYTDPEKALRNSLERLKLDYVDLYHIHWWMTIINIDTMEVTGPPIHKVWEAFEDLVDKNLTKSIGLCNWNVMMLVEILAGARIKPSVVQVELHPYLQQEGLVKTWQKFGIQVTAYAPLASPGFPYNDYTKTKLLNHQVLNTIAEKHGKTTAQIALAWNLKRGVAVIPKSTNNERIKENSEATQVELDDEDLELIKGIDEGYRVFNPRLWFEPEYGWLDISDFD